jgi:uncharacterized protein (TIGR02231 family)
MDRATMSTTRTLISSSAVALITVIAGSTAAGPTPIASAVVYADRAQVTRTLTANCATREATFTGLPSTIQTKSLWASIAGGGEVIGLTHREVASGPRAEAKALQAQVRKLDDRLAQINASVSAAAAVVSKLSSFRSHTRQIWGLQAATKTPPVGSWEAALNMLRQQEVQARSKQRKLSTRRRKLWRERAGLTQQLQQIARKRRRTTLTVTVMLKCAGRRAVRLSYVVPGATWRMSYQLRADPKRRRVRLVTQAVVQQGTGEDWDKITLAVSTANLQRSNIPPRLGTMRVTTNKPHDTRKVLTRRFEHRRHLTTSKKEPRAQGSSTTVSGGKPQQAGVPDKGLAMRLTAARKVSVPADGRKVVVVLRQKEIKGKFYLETVPKLYPYVYNKVEVQNPFDFTLLPGRIELFSGKAYLGNARLKLRAPGEPFSFSMGVDNQLQVHRWIKKEKLKGAGTFGSSKKLRHRYMLQVGNWTRRAKTVRVLENVPVSQVREIKVSLSADTAKPKAWNKADGIVTWELKIPPRGKRSMILDYTVALPKEYIVHGYQRED